MNEIKLENYSDSFLKKAVTFYLKLQDGSIASEIKEELECNK